VLPLRSRAPLLKKLSAHTGYLGLRMPKHPFTAALSRAFKRPYTATSANPSGARSGGYDSYSPTTVLFS
jgi:tRNA A37 threonylcarbamoyladenosine synthetase subunit TsaC/SUA5/YrdC